MGFNSYILKQQSYAMFGWLNFKDHFQGRVVLPVWAVINNEYLRAANVPACSVNMIHA
jgi:hypothetical protein